MHKSEQEKPQHGSAHACRGVMLFCSIVWPFIMTCQAVVGDVASLCMSL